MWWYGQPCSCLFIEGIQSPLQLLNYMQLCGELSAKHQNNSLVRKAEWTSLPSLADAKKWASKGLRHLCRLQSGLGSLCSAPPTACLPAFLHCLLDRVQKGSCSLEGWCGGPSATQLSLAEGTALQGRWEPPSSPCLHPHSPLPYRRPAAARAAPSPVGSSWLQPGTGMHEQVCEQRLLASW